MIYLEFKPEINCSNKYQKAWNQELLIILGLWLDLMETLLPV